MGRNMQAGQIVLPRHEVRLKLPLIEDEVLREMICYPERDVPLIKVVSEQSVGRWRPDLTAVRSYPHYGPDTPQRLIAHGSDCIKRA